MPLLTPHNASSSHPPGGKGKDEEWFPIPTTDRARITADPVQSPPASTPASLAPIPSAINGGQPTNPRNTVPYTSPFSLQQPPAANHNATSNNDKTISPSNVVLHPTPVVSPASGFFTNAHHFVINQLTAITQNIDSGATVLQQLKKKGKPAAMHNSSTQTYPLRCHPDTCKGLRTHISQWG
ncbi:hypothetical protein P691DRAFT_760684 [Macrolepiota fuliginosa MF-IS2]|uniref:Uncharacterized protein n=1 Tax=Macrolepiota fuliginosa MF-IS2 TaxID=1400762 RepID=A0A9P5XDG4_9AGAR|nr:hypothetical protein P691DRAFT_760684 [Macrolepiota fuliginosa MF-IS2]